VTLGIRGTVVKIKAVQLDFRPNNKNGKKNVAGDLSSRFDSTMELAVFDYDFLLVFSIVGAESTSSSTAP